MPFISHSRPYDLVIFGATGYTGLMIAEHIAEHFPTDLKWAVAGRSAEKLEKVIVECKIINSDRIQPEIEVVNLNDADLLKLAQKTCVLITTVGPFTQYGEHAFKACAEAGTHYIDSTGEAPWTSQMIKKYHDKARETGAIIIPQCGIESAPSDMVTWAMAQLLRNKLSASVGDVIVEIHELRSAASGGTLATVLSLLGSTSLKDMQEANTPYSLSPIKNSVQAPKPSWWTRLTGLHSDHNLGLLTTSPVGGFNAAIVFRTWGLLQNESPLLKQAYGPNFTYREFAHARGVIGGMAAHFGMTIGAMMLMLPPVRAIVSKFIFRPGDGPDKAEARKEYIEFRGTAEPDPKQNGQIAWGKLNYTGSMYYLTAVLMAAAAETILQENPDLQGGVYTPACLGQPYMDRLNRAGLNVEASLITTKASKL